MPRIWISDDKKLFFVETKTLDFEGEPMVWGRLMDDDGVAQELPFMSIGNHMPYTSWVVYDGDPTPILRRFQEFQEQGRQ
jgi:hypothetical protein